MTNPDPASASTDPEVILKSLRQSVHKALDRKEKLQQYAVTWVDNAPRYTGPDAPTTSDPHRSRGPEASASYDDDDDGAARDEEAKG